jgi:hypothetical protein
VGSQRALKKLTRIISKEIGEKMQKKHIKEHQKKQALNGCSAGFSVGSQWVLSGYPVSAQGAHGYSACSFLSTQGVLR